MPRNLLKNLGRDQTKKESRQPKETSEGKRTNRESNSRTKSSREKRQVGKENRKATHARHSQTASQEG